MGEFHNKINQLFYQKKIYMRQLNWKYFIPHLVSIAILLLIAIVYTYPALTGQVIAQHDITQWKGMAQDAFNYKAQHGNFPFWNKNLFSGMPNYQIAFDGKSTNFMINFHQIFTLGLPKPTSMFFLASLCFYILSVTLGLNNFVRVLVSIAFAYCTYDPVIFSAGHESKFFALATLPALIAGILLIFKGKYWIGLITTALFTMMEISNNHFQITYYGLLIIACITASYSIHWIQQGKFKHMAIALTLSFVAGLIGLGNTGPLIPATAEYAKYTTRGGKAIDINKESGNASEIQHTKGLDNTYAFMWSMHKAEPLQLMMPNAFGASSSNTFADKESFAEKLSNTGIPPQGIAQLSQMLPQYWGGLESTSGPVYIGTLIALLAIIGFVVVKKHRWWLLAATLLGIILSWGKYFGINDFLFNYLPLYNKFRAPSMALVIPQITLPITAGLSLQTLFFNKHISPVTFVEQHFKKIVYTLGITIGVLLLIYFMNDYNALLDEQLKQMFANPQAGGEAVGNSVVNALKSERKDLFFNGIIRVMLFAAMTIGALWLFMKRKASAVVVLVVLTVVSTIDLFAIGKQYLPNDSFSDPIVVNENAFRPQSFDTEIMKDKDPHFRVLNLQDGDPFQNASTSYYHRSIGGYHAAKLSIYQDLIQSQFADSLNPNIINMLDVRYIVTNKHQVVPNPLALGAAWFVKHIEYVPTAAAELNSLRKFDAKTTAIVQEQYRQTIGNAPTYDSSATIALQKYDNDEIIYKTSAKSNQFAVLSEIYYPAGWNAYLNGKKVDYVKTNYVLRGIAIPAGQHELVFKFEPSSIQMGNTIMLISNILFYLCFIPMLWVSYKKFTNKKYIGTIPDSNS